MDPPPAGWPCRAAADLRSRARPVEAWAAEILDGSAEFKRFKFGKIEYLWNIYELSMEYVWNRYGDIYGMSII